MHLELQQFRVMSIALERQFQWPTAHLVKNLLIPILTPPPPTQLHAIPSDPVTVTKEKRSMPAPALPLNHLFQLSKSSFLTLLMGTVHILGSTVLTAC